MKYRNARFYAIGAGVLAFLFIAALISQAAQLNTLERDVTALANQTQLENRQEATLSSELAEVAATASSTAAKESAVSAEVASGGGGGSIQNAVAAASPAVVSIVESEEVPQYSVSYQDPFGDSDPFGAFAVPVYTQTGTQEEEVSAGSGFLIRSSGYILTNKHVVPDAGATYTVTLASGTKENGTVVWRDPSNDLAVVKIAGSGYPTITLGDSSTLSLGESVFAIGNALGQYSNSVSTGVISGLDRTITAQDENGNSETLNGVIQTDTAINPGNSGGPLMTTGGVAVGVNVATVEGSENIAFAIPSDQVKTALAQLGI